MSCSRVFLRSLVAAVNLSRAFAPPVDHALCRLPHRDLAAGLFHRSSCHIPATHKSLNLALSSLLLSNKIPEAVNLFDRAEIDGRCEFPPALCNSLLTAASSGGPPSFAIRVFDKMLVKGIAFSNVGFGVFIGAFCRLRGLDEVLDLVEEIKRRFCMINGSVVAVLIVDGLCRVGRMEEAWRALEGLRMRGCKPDFIAYRIVSEAFRLAGRAEDAGRILKQKRKLGVAPRAKDYGEFIVSLISERRVEEAMELGEAIVNGDFPIEDGTLNALIGSVSALDPDSAILFCNYMIGKERFPSPETLTILSRSLCKNGKGNEMWDIFKVILDKGHLTEVEQYNVMVSFLCKAGRLREAYDVFKEMKKKGFPPDICSYNTLMEACCREDLLRPAKRLWDEMFANGCCPNLQTYNTLIKKLSEEGEAEEAHHLFHHMLDKGETPDIITYTTLIKVMCHEKRLESAIEIFKMSLEQDFMIASSTLSALVLSLCIEGNFVEASGVLYSLPSNVQSSDSHVILLKSLIDAGGIDMAIKHIEQVKSNPSFKLNTVITELIASFSTAPKLEPVIQFLQAIRVHGYGTNDGPWMHLLEGQNDCT